MLRIENLSTKNIVRYGDFVDKCESSHSESRTKLQFQSNILTKERIKEARCLIRNLGHPKRERQWLKMLVVWPVLCNKVDFWMVKGMEVAKRSQCPRKNGLDTTNVLYFEAGMICKRVV